MLVRVVLYRRGSIFFGHLPFSIYPYNGHYPNKIVPDGSCDLAITLHVVCVQLEGHRQMNRERAVNDIRPVHPPQRTCYP